MHRIILQAYPALENRSFRIFFTGQVISFGGTWLQNAVQLWLVYLITHSAFAVGATGFLLVVPTMLLAPVGGLVVDRFDTRKVLYVTQCLEISQAIVFGMLVITGNISLIAIYALTFALGVMNAFDIPARHTYVAEIVSGDLLPSAHAMNETLMSLGVILGSSAAGILIATVGLPVTFFVNAASFVAVVVTLVLMPTGHEREKKSERSLGMFFSGIRYAVTDSNLRLLLLLIGITMFLGFPYRTILPVAANEMFHAGSIGFGWLYAAPGVGAFIGALIVSRNSKNLPVARFVVGGYLLIEFSLVVFAATKLLFLAIAELAVAGMGLTFATATIPATLRRTVNKEMLGRIVGLDVMMFYVGMAAGNLAIGYFTQKFGLQLTIGINGCMLLALAVTLLFLGKFES